MHILLLKFGDKMKTKQMNRWLFIGLSLIVINVLILLLDRSLPIFFFVIKRTISLLMPFIIGFFVAFLLHRLVDTLEKRGINRMVSVLFIFLMFSILIAYIVSILIPELGRQIEAFDEGMPEMQRQVEGFITAIWQRLSFVPKEYQFSLHDIEHYAESEFLNLRFRRPNLTYVFN